VEKSVWVRK